jgi:hypothetical protein
MREHNWNVFRLVNGVATGVCEKLGWAWQGDHLANDGTFFTLRVWTSYNVAKKNIEGRGPCCPCPSSFWNHRNIDR